MSTSRINQIIDRPLTKEEMDERMSKMIKARQERDAERRRELGMEPPPREKPIIERPLTQEEVEERMQRMRQDRNEREQESAARKTYSPT